MNLRIADTFTDSLARLTGDEQKAVKITAFDLQADPAGDGMRFHKLDKAKDKNFWSVRVSSDLRLIVHRTEGSLLLCYVDHHDKAYQWAERRKIQTHPTTGAAQLVEVRETVQEVRIPVYVRDEAPSLATLPFARIANDALLGCGVPEEWLNDVRQATEDSFLALSEHLPAEAAESLLQFATGGTPVVARISPAIASSFDHPDALRRFRVMTNVEELERALEFPWDKWTIFLHPEQRQWVEREYNGPARVSGSAGTGKTIVALHRAVFLARANPDARILLTTYSHTLANALRMKLKRLVSNEPKLAERIDVHSIEGVGSRLYKSHFGPAKLATRAVIAHLLRTAAVDVDENKFNDSFLIAEWEQVVDAWQLESWEAYRDVARLGRKTRLPEPRRAVLWSIFERVRAGMAAQDLITVAGMFSQLAAAVAASKRPPYDFVIIDEAQDLSVSHLRFFAALGRERPNALFFAGDIGQRIFQQPFSWRALGVDIRGRSRTLRVNYRTSHQIRRQADRLLSQQISDADGNIEERGNAVSVFNGPLPTIRVAADRAEETSTVATWLIEHSQAGVAAHEFGIFVRSDAELDRARAAITAAAIPFKVLDDDVETTSGFASLSTMHLAKGLEFRAVVVMACDDEIIPLQSRIETVGDDADLQEVYDTERHLLYVACTRARDHLLVTSVDPASEFLDDLRLSGRLPG